MKAKPKNTSYLARAKNIKLAAFDVDGVMTDGSLMLTDRGEEIKVFHTLDGQGLKMLQRSGVEIAIITARSSRVVELRAQNLGITHLYQGNEDKLATFSGLLEMLDLRASEACYMGDDVIDLPILRLCGFAVTVPEAPAMVRDCCHYITQRPGGRGAVRELCEVIMHAQATLAEQLGAYLK